MNNCYLLVRKLGPVKIINFFKVTYKYRLFKVNHRKYATIFIISSNITKYCFITKPTSKKRKVVSSIVRIYR